MSNPETTIVEEMKELLSDPKNRIKLDDFVMKHLKLFLDATNLERFPVEDSNIQNEDFIERIEKYEEKLKDLQIISIYLAKWGKGDQLKMLEKIFTRLSESDKGSSGVGLWLNLSWYPLLVLLYSVGITAIYSENYDILKIIFNTKIQENPLSGMKSPIIVTLVEKTLKISEYFKLVSGNERHHAPKSEYLYTNFQPILEDILFLGRSYEDIFDIFEILIALVYANEINRDWGPPGRFAWKHDRDNSPYELFINDAKKNKGEWWPIKAGLFNGSFNDFIEVSSKYKDRLDKSSWR